MTNDKIDGGKAFDWSRASLDYAQYRDIYPQEFYDKIVGRKLCVDGQKVLDIGTGTGVLPRNLYRYGATWTGTDISENQIKQAKAMSKGMDIAYETLPAEKLCFPDGTFDVITACQCFEYFKHEQTAGAFHRVLRAKGRVLLLYMAWLPYDDRIAEASEKLVEKYNPKWSGKGESMHPISIPDCYNRYFETVYHEEYPLQVRFTRESWHGRMKSCRGVGASLTQKEIAQWQTEHLRLLEEIAPLEFFVLHYSAIAELRKREVVSGRMQKTHRNM